MLLTQNAILGIFAFYERADRRFGAFVGLRHRIGEQSPARILVAHIGALTKIWPNDLAGRVGQPMGESNTVGIDRHAAKPIRLRPWTHAFCHAARAVSCAAGSIAASLRPVRRPGYRQWPV